MIYCVIPEALEEELLEKLTLYYADDDNADNHYADCHDNLHSALRRRDIHEHRRSQCHGARLDGNDPPAERGPSPCDTGEHSARWRCAWHGPDPRC